MEHFFNNKEALIHAASSPSVGLAPRTYQEISLLIALVEIREAIEEQTAKLCGEQAQWDCSALAKLAHDVSATQDTTSALAHLLNDLVPRVEALETKYELVDRHLKELCGEINGFSAQVQACMDATQIWINHQGETAAKVSKLGSLVEEMSDLLAVLAAKVDK